MSARTQPKPTGGLISANAANAAAAIKGRGFQPTPGNIRMVLRAARGRGATGETHDADWWDDLISELPLGNKRARATLSPGWRVAS